MSAAGHTKGPVGGFRTATKCELCGGPLPKRRSDRYATVHSKCAKAWVKLQAEKARAEGGR